MNKMFYFLLATVPFWYACSGSEKKEVKEIEMERPATDEPAENAMVFNIPSPSEQFEIISSLDGVKNTMLVNSPDKANTYATAVAKALNFGIYTADVAYLTSYKETSKYMAYFGKLEKLGTDIGVAQVFGKELSERAKKWDGNADSLFRLLDQTYTRSFQRLIEIDKGKELSLMLVGGWVESMHLALGSSKGFGKSPKMDEVLADQKLVGENLLDFLLDYQDDADVATYITKVSGILAAYDNMDCTEAETAVSKSGNKVRLTGGNSCTMNQKTFSALKKEVAAVRNEIIK
jgi:hypothetical protein